MAGPAPLRESRARGAFAGLCLLMAAGCGGGVPRPAGDESPRVAISAEVTQYREDEVAGRLQVSLTNHDRAPVRVESVRLDAPDFAAAATSRPALDLAPGQRTDVPVGYGAPRCGGTVPRRAQPGAVTLDVVTADGARGTVRVALPVPSPTLDRLLERSCRREQLARLLDATFTDLHAPPGAATARVTLRLAYAGPDAVTVTEVSGSVIFDLVPAPGARLPVTLTRTRPRAAFDVVARPGRCDPHAFAESKKTFLFTVYLSLPSSGGSTYLIVEPDTATKQAMDRWVRARCGLTGG